MPRISIDISEDLKQRIKIHIAKTKQTEREFVTQAVELLIKSKNQKGRGK